MLFCRPTYDWLVVGLGNPGRQYEKTRHNAGFLALDALAQKLGVRIGKERFKAVTAQAEYAGQRMLLMQPQTFMNASGIAVEAAAHYYKLPPERVLVLFDDISLPIGRLRIRAGGSAGGHNGLKSIISSIGSDQFPRVKIGVGAKPHPDYDLADWVLSAVAKSDWPAFEAAFHGAGDAALEITTQLQRAVNSMVSNPPVMGRLKFGEPKIQRTIPPRISKNHRPETIVEPTVKPR